MWRMAACGAAMALTLALGACGDDDGEAPELPEGAVAVVGDAQIDDAQLADATAALRRAQSDPGGLGGRLPPDALDPPESEHHLREQALSLLLLATTVEQEAAERGIEVSLGEARRRWQRIVREQFPTPKALRDFLGGQTERDVVRQLRIQLLYERIHRQIANEAGGGRESSRAVERFQDDLRSHWQARTACRDGLEASGCPGVTDGEDDGEDAGEESDG